MYHSFYWDGSQIAGTLTANNAGGSQRMPDKENFNCVIVLEGNGSRPSHFGDGYKESDKMYTLNTTEVHAVCYGICGYESNSMKSDNPHSGIYEAKTSRTLDLNGGNPACNQGGIAIVEKVGSFYPQMKAESQCYREDGVSNTLVVGTNPGFQNGVVYAIDRAAFNQGENAQYDFQISGGGTAQTIIAKGPGAVCYKKPSEACKQETSRESETNM